MSQIIYVYKYQLLDTNHSGNEPECVNYIDDNFDDVSPVTLGM